MLPVSLILKAVVVRIGELFGSISARVTKLLSASCPWLYWVTSITLPLYKSLITLEDVISVLAAATPVPALLNQTKSLPVVNS